MRYKVAPSPVDRELLAATHAAVPTDPRSTDDCCARIRDQTALPDRDAAESWLVFLTALGLATETDHGYRRATDSLDSALDALAEPFRERVYGVDELLSVLDAADGSLSATEAFEQVRGDVPGWERERHDDWVDTWTDRSRTLLDWAVLFGLADRTDAGYRRL